MIRLTTMQTTVAANRSPEMTADIIAVTANKIGVIREESAARFNLSRVSFFRVEKKTAGWNSQPARNRGNFKL